MEWADEMRRKGAECSSPEALLDLARAEGVPMTAEEAQAVFARLHPPVGELTDQELEAVSGGGCGELESNKWLGRRCIIPFTTSMGFDVAMRRWQSVDMEGGRYYRCDVCAREEIVTTTFITEAPEYPGNPMVKVRCERGHIPEEDYFYPSRLQYFEAF